MPSTTAPLRAWPVARAVRAALVALACTTNAARVQAQATTQPPLPMTPDRQLARAIYKELVEINTVDSVGSVTTAAEAAARRLLAAGFPASDVQVLVPAGHPDKGNLVARYRGRAGSTRQPILLLAHLDVVAANRADWPRDPFTLYEENGYFLGRGTADDKAMASIFVANLIRYKREGWVPDRDIILALTADEESETLNGVKWLLANHRPLIDAQYAINEGGGGMILGGRPAANTVLAAEKVYTDYTLETTNPGGHSSVPRPDNAIYQLAAGLERLARFRFTPVLNPVTRAFFAQTARVETRPEIAAAMRTIAAGPDTATSGPSADAAATLSRDPYFSSLLRTTCVATRLSGGHAYNALPQRATANVNCRILPTSTDEEIRATLARVVADTGIHISHTSTQREAFGVAPASIDPQVLSATTALTKRMWGDIPVIPVMSTGATDGRFLRAAGIPTYGIDGIFGAPGESNEHGRDEKLRMRSFYEGLDFLYQLVKQVSGAPST